MGLRILCLTPWFPNSEQDGRFSFILHSVRALADAGHDLSVLVTRPWVPRLLAGASPDWAHAFAPIRITPKAVGARLHVLRFPSLPRYLLSEYADTLYRVRTARRIRCVIEEQGIQLIHAHTERTAHSAVDIGQELGIPVVVSLHGISTARELLDTPSKRERLRKTLSTAAKVVLVGEPLRRYFAPLAGGDRNFRIVPNGFFLHGYERQAKGPWGPVVRFISTSNLDEGKGIDLNLRAFAALKQSGSTAWTYTIVGDGVERAALERMSVDLGIGSRVTFQGPLRHDRAMQALSDADVFVLPSYREAFGVAYVEAMASGLLTIGVEGQGPSAFISHGETGLLVKPRDEASLLDALNTVIQSAPEMQRVAAAGRNAVRAGFTWARHAERLTEVFDEAVHCGTRAG